MSIPKIETPKIPKEIPAIITAERGNAAGR